MKEQFTYPGDRNLVSVDKEDAELARIFLNDGNTRAEVVKMFVDAGYSITKAVEIYIAAARHMS